MLIYGLYVTALILFAVALWFGWHRVREGRKPPELEDGGKGPAPAERDERWDPRQRYGDGRTTGDPAAQPATGKDRPAAPRPGEADEEER
jgi:hypothetical protein